MGEEREEEDGERSIERLAREDASFYLGVQRICPSNHFV